MITVRCPNCEAAYQLDASKLADGGRKLKCAKCHTVWIARAEPPVAEAPVEAPAEPTPAAVATPPAESPAEPAGEELPPPPDGLITRPPAMEAVVRVGGWRHWVRGDNIWRSGALAMIALGLLAGAGVVWMKLGQQGAIEELHDPLQVPPMEHAPRDTGVVQPPEGVVLHRVHGDVVPLEGEGAGVSLTVRGLLTNTKPETVQVPALRLELLGADGQVADMWPVSNVSGTLAPLEEQAWSVSLTAPDMSSVKGWRVVFVKDVSAAEPPL